MALSTRKARLSPTTEGCSLPSCQCLRDAGLALETRSLHGLLPRDPFGATSVRGPPALVGCACLPKRSSARVPEGTSKPHRGSNRQPLSSTIRRASGLRRFDHVTTIWPRRGHLLCCLPRAAVLQLESLRTEAEASERLQEPAVRPRLLKHRLKRWRNGSRPVVPCEERV